jgi:hypothetical protein
MASSRRGYFVAFNVEFALFPERASVFLEQCGVLVGMPSKQSPASGGCKFRVEQLDLRRGGSRQGGAGGLEISSHLSINAALDEARCNATKHCALVVTIVDSNGHAVVPAPKTPLVVSLESAGIVPEEEVEVTATAVVRALSKKCFGSIAEGQLLGELSNTEWSKHAQAVFRASASLRGHPVHNYGGYPSGQPWLENYWVRYFATDFSSPQFGSFVPIFAQWVDLRFEADRRKVHCCRSSAAYIAMQNAP